ncbi:hypothetical protein [Streptomyces sp. NPDC004065]|uniref:hypothetical protein n=1 Tax=Streptomyces sp. NPDC004065 TaxID=3364689 RepID=UPI00384B4F99
MPARPIRARTRNRNRNRSRSRSRSGTRTGSRTRGGPHAAAPGTRTRDGSRTRDGRRPAHAPRARVLAAAVLVLLAAAVLAGCRDGQGVQDEGPSSVSRSLEGHPCATAHRAPVSQRISQRSFCATSVAQ